MGYEDTTLADEIIALLFSSGSTYIYKKILWERIQERRTIEKNVFRQNIYRLNKKGIIKNSDGKYALSKKGRLLYASPYKTILATPLETKRIIVLFDIPESKKKVREWLRMQIRLWGFTMIQKSVWLGHGPLPEEFDERLRLLGVEKNVKVFNVQKTGKL